MSTGVSVSPAPSSLKGFLYVILIGASLINLGANLYADLTVPEKSYPVGWGLWLLLVSKPLLVPALTGLFFLGTRGAASSIRLGSFYVALLFCWGGDIALMLGDIAPLGKDLDKWTANCFMIGLGSFGVAHLFFIWACQKQPDWRHLMSPGVLPFIVYGYTLYSTIYYTEEMQKSLVMRVIIAVYMVVLLANGLSGFLHLRQKKTPSASSIFVGIVLFVQSDSIIAVNKYVQILPLDRFAIMATYILGVYLMVRGCILDCQELAQREPAQPPVRLSSAA